MPGAQQGPRGRHNVSCRKCEQVKFAGTFQNRHQPAQAREQAQVSAQSPQQGRAATGPPPRQTAPARQAELALLARPAELARRQTEPHSQRMTAPQRAQAAVRPAGNVAYSRVRRRRAGQLPAAEMPAGPDMAPAVQTPAPNSARAKRHQARLLRHEPRATAGQHRPKPQQPAPELEWR